MLMLPRTSLRIPGRLLATVPTRAPGIWRGLPTTVELTRPVEVVRIDGLRHGLVGEWFALGEWIERVGGVPPASAAPPGAPGARVTLEAGTVLNVGVCDPTVGDPTAGAHAELVRGSISKTRPLEGWWGGVPPR